MCISALAEAGAECFLVEVNLKCIYLFYEAFVVAEPSSFAVEEFSESSSCLTRSRTTRTITLFPAANEAVATTTIDPLSLL